MKNPLHQMFRKTNAIGRAVDIRWLFLVVLMTMSSFPSLLAEGSKDFVNYPGHRMFLDTRDPQQLKVFASAGEFINIGASHVGINQGFITVYRPDGTLHTTFNNDGATFGLAIINNNVEEVNGPTGGGSLMGAGYRPGVVPVQSDEEGIWTVIFDYPMYDEDPFDNLLNSAPWTRLNDQPGTRTVVLAWDITVSSDGAGNDVGSTLHEGRVYSNEHISVQNGNGVLTSPTFYVFTPSGFLYQVNFMDTDPYRFPISSNKLGITTGDFSPIYKSKNEIDYTRSADASTWDPNQLYLYEPQAQDTGQLVNNKIFFNPPDITMPSIAQVTDIHGGNNTHNTWLFSDLEGLELNEVSFQGFDPDGVGCEPGTFQFDAGGLFIINASIGGQLELQLDMNENGLFTDPVDVTLNDFIRAGGDTVIWDGLDNLGNVLSVTDSFSLSYTGTIRYGEIHIAMTDVENNLGGVTFKLLNPPPGTVDSLFFYDHTDIGGTLSGGGTTGSAQPTTTPFTYSNNFGNDRYLDQWIFAEFVIEPVAILLQIVPDCPCTPNNTPVLGGISGAGTYCVGDDILLAATNTNGLVDSVTYTWSGPANFTFSETIGSGDTSVAFVGNASLALAGDYFVIVENDLGCADTSLAITVDVSIPPVLSVISGGGDYCVGDDITLSAMSLSQLTNGLSYIWTGPNSFADTGVVSISGLIELNLPNATVNSSGSYTLILVSDAGCLSALISTEISVTSSPIIAIVSGDDIFCEGDSTTLLASNTAIGVGDFTYTWNGPNGFFETGMASGTDTFGIALTNMNASFTGDYILNLTSATGCASTSDTVMIEIGEIPVITNLTGDGDYCVGDTVTLSANNLLQQNINEIIYTWTGPNGFIFIDTVNAFEPFILTLDNVSPDASGDYTLVLETDLGCRSIAQTTTITVHPIAVISDITEGPFCVGTNATLSATNTVAGATDCIYTWTGPGGFFVQGTSADGAGPFTATISNISGVDEGQYILSLICNGICEAASDTANVLVEPGLFITGISGDGDYCEGDDVVLNATSSVSADSIIYTWTGPNGFEVSGIVPNNGPFEAPIPDIQVNNAGDYTLNIMSTDGCLGDPVTVTVNVFPTPQLVNIIGGGAYCATDTVSLSATEGSMIDTVIFTWVGPNLIFHDTVTTGNSILTLPNVTTAQSGSYEVTISTFNGCLSPTSFVNVNVNEIPVIDSTSQDTIICAGENILLTATNSVPDLGMVTYTWTGPNGFEFSASANGDDNFDVTINAITPDQIGTYTLVVEAAGGCESDAISVDVQVLPIPNLTPISGGGSYCEGDTVILTFSIADPTGIDSSFFTCNFPDGSIIVTQGAGDDVMTVIIPNITLAQSGVFECSAESYDGCIGSLQTILIEVQATPVITDILGNGFYCEGETFVLSANNGIQNTGPIIYTWTGPNGFMFTDTTDATGPFIASVPNPTLDNAGEYCLILETEAGCQSDTACVTVGIHPKPVLSPLNDDANACEGDTITLTTAVMFPDTGTYIVTCIEPNGTISMDTVMAGEPVIFTIENVMVGQTGTYTCFATSINGCESDSVSLNIDVTSVPFIFNITPDTVICEGDDLLLTANNATPGLDTLTYTWTGPNGFIFVGMALDDFPLLLQNVTPDMAGKYCLQLVSSTGCASDELCVNVEVNPKPILESIMGADSVYCEGDDVILFTYVVAPDSGSFEVTCTGPNSFFETDTIMAGDTVFIVILDVTLDDAGVYSCTATSADGCISETVSVTLEIQPTPEIINITTDTVICEGETLILTAENATGGLGAINYTWTGPNGFIFMGTSANNFPVTLPNMTPDMSGEYCLVLASQAGCGSDTMCVNIIVNPKPVLDALMNGDTTVCTGADVTFTTTIIFPLEGVFEVTCTGPNGFSLVTSVNAGEPIILELLNVTLDDAGTYTCTATSAEGCESESVSVTLTVEATPVIEDLSPDGIFCEGESTTLTAGNATPGIGNILYTWTGPNGLMVTDVAPNGGPFPLNLDGMTPDDSGQYCLTLESDAGCGSEEQCVNITVNPLPTAEFAENGTFCEGDIATITATIQLNGSASADWSITGPSFNESGTSTTDETISFDITIDASTAGIYTLNVTSDQDCEVASQSVTLSINQIDAPTVTGSQTEVCLGETVELTATEYEGDVVMYEWFCNDISLGTTTEPNFPTTPIEDCNYTVEVTVDGCSKTSATFTVTVFLDPVAADDQFELEFNTPLEDGDILGNDETGAGVTVTILSGPSNGTAEIGVDGSLTYTSNPFFAGTDVIVYEICSIDCPESCSEATITIIVNDVDCFAPNVITPNGDGANDAFFIPCLENENFPQNAIKIFNRWGDEIFVAEPYQNDWEGLHDNKPLPAGTYFYLLKLRPEDEDFMQGFIKIAR